MVPFLGEDILHQKKRYFSEDIEVSLFILKSTFLKQKKVPSKGPFSNKGTNLLSFFVQKGTFLRKKGPFSQAKKICSFFFIIYPNRMAFFIVVSLKIMYLFQVRILFWFLKKVPLFFQKGDHLRSNNLLTRLVISPSLLLTVNFQLYELK